MRNAFGVTITGVSLAAMGLATASGAVAQTSDPPQAGAPQARSDQKLAAAAPAAKTDDLSEVVVTANLTSQLLQDVPAAVTAVSGEQLAKLGVSDITGLSEFAPSILLNRYRAQSSLFIRGVGQTLNTPNADPAIATNINGVYVPSEMAGISFYDVDRVEVLPGPQGTLYGKDAVGGVVNVHTKRPGSTLGGEASVELGNYDRIQSFAAVDLPLSDTLAVRVAGNLIKHNGYADNGTDDEKTYGGRATALWSPTDATTVTAAVGFDHAGGIGFIQQSNPPPNGDWRHFGPSNTSLMGTAINTTQASMDVDHKLSDNWGLTSLTGFNRLGMSQHIPLWLGPPPAQLNLNSQTDESYTQEFRLNGTWSRTNALLGVHYFHNSPFQNSSVSPFPGLQTNVLFESPSDGAAAFGQVTYSLLDPLRLTGGLRYSYIDKSIKGTNTSNITPPDNYAAKGNDSRADWKVGMEYDLAAQSMLYGSVATGFNPSGFSTDQTKLGSGVAAPFQEMKLTAYSGGIKNRFLDNKITLNMEGYYYNYKNYQVSARDPVTLLNLVYNADKATVYGAQMDSIFRITEIDRLTLNAGYLSATAVRLVTPVCNCNGFELPYSPKWTGNAAYDHTFRLPNGASINALVNLNFRTNYWILYQHPPGGRDGGGKRTDVDLTYDAASGKWSVTAWGRNLTNDIQYQLGTLHSSTQTVLEPAPPRTYGVRFGVNFY